jgi:hypothetical protein
MNQLEFLLDWGVWVVGVAFWVSVAFAPVITFFWRWWKDSWGWNIISLEVVIALALLRTILVTEFGLVRSGIETLWLTDISVSLIPVIIIWRAVIIIREQYKAVRRSEVLHAYRLQPESHRVYSGAQSR